MKSKVIHYGKDLVIAIAVLFMLVFSLNATQSQPLESQTVSELNTDWNISKNQTVVEDEILPTSIDANANDVITISRTLDSNFSNEQTILIRGSLQSVVVRLDDQLIYSKDFEDNVFNTHASLFHFISIPQNSEGKSLEVSFQSPFEDFSGTINDVYFGTPSAIQSFLMSNYGPKLIIGFVWFIISILMVIFNFVFFSKKQRYYGYIALFGVFMSLWLMNESRILHLYINNDFFAGSISYISIAVAPIAMIAFFKSKILKDDHKMLSYLSFAFMINLFFVIVLHMTGVYSFFESAIFTNILNIFTIIYVLYRILYYYFKTNNKHYLLYFIVFGIFSTFLALEIISFLIKDFDSISLYASIGMVVEFFIVLVISMILIFNRNQVIYKEKAYEEIARTDQLTKVKSRYAFESDMDHLFYQSEEPVAVIYFDFDDLKRINDRFGHLKGDQLLVQGCHKMRDILNHMAIYIELVVTSSRVYPQKYLKKTLFI